MIRLWCLIAVIASFQSCAQPGKEAIKEISIIGRTTDTLPHLEYGLGEDRLGGAKMTFIDTSVLTEVVDSIRDVYKVRLSQNHFAWMPKRNFKVDTSLRRQPYYLSSNWKVFGDEKYDYVTINLDERLAYRSVQQINPAR